MSAETRERKPLLARLVAARTWVWFAVAMLALFGVVHLLGWRDDTRFISGTAALDFTLVRGMIYGLAYFGAVIGAPILLLAAGFLALFAHAMKAGKPAVEGIGSPEDKESEPRR